MSIKNEFCSFFNPAPASFPSRGTGEIYTGKMEFLKKIDYFFSFSNSKNTDHFPERVDAIVNEKAYQELLIDMIEKRMIDFFE